MYCHILAITVHHVISVLGCLAYGMTMTSYHGFGISKHNRVIFIASIDECMTSCVTETTYLCLSVDYEIATGRCHLATVGWLDVDESARVDTADGYTFMSRDCGKTLVFSYEVI